MKRYNNIIVYGNINFYLIHIADHLQLKYTVIQTRLAQFGRASAF